jgi:hypothetical protein
MKPFLWGRGVKLLLLLANLHSLKVAASPSINVDLQTSFDSAPYLIELL